MLGLSDLGINKTVHSLILLTPPTCDMNVSEKRWLQKNISDEKLSIDLCKLGLAH